MPSGKEHSSTRTPPLAQPTGGSPQVNTLIVLAGTIQELRGSVPPVRASLPQWEGWGLAIAWSCLGTGPPYLVATWCV